MENTTQEAYEKLKTYATFNNTYEAFEAKFWDNLDKSKTDLAIELLLRVNYKLLTSKGELLNEIFDKVDEETKQRLDNWLKESYDKKVKKWK